MKSGQWCRTRLKQRVGITEASALVGEEAEDERHIHGWIIWQSHVIAHDASQGSLDAGNMPLWPAPLSSIQLPQ
jgi:hypothetical protein